ncbi:MAG: hybrid sensor histidine kinase/response regulator [Rhizobiales bacterium]|nr:hybrid sensor histidine kinase/response regulator [Hyphomicrobiales bacterium]
MTQDNDPFSTPELNNEKPVLFLKDNNKKRYDLPGKPSEREIELTEKIEKLEKINRALIRRVERSMDQRANSYSLFQSAILLEEQVKARTLELRSALDELEVSNKDLSKAKEQAEYSNSSKTKFLAAASHDLLQPLSAARLNMSTLQGEDVSPQAGRLISQVDRSLQTIEELLRTLFDISKLDARVSLPDICRFSADRIIRGLHADFSSVANQKNLKIKVFSLPLIVSTDPIFLRRILQNLVSNALRYTHEGGILIGCRRRGKNLRFEIWDTGAGIPLSEHDKIFDEFHRCKNDVHQDGLGLGLAIVKRMADAAGHEIDFKSVPGKGSVFSVTVPISSQQYDIPEEPSVIPDSKPIQLKLEDSFILLIEDNPNVRVAMKTLFSRWGAQCLAADSHSSIQEQLDQVERVPDVIVADYHLKDEVVGPEVVAHIRNRYNAPELPAVIVTATPYPAVLEHAEQENCELLTKPVAPAELRALLIHLLNK